MSKSHAHPVRDFVSFADFNRDEVWELLRLATALKTRRTSSPLRGRSVGLIFQNPSTRTAVSFAVGVAQLGGHPLILAADVLQIKRGESPRDTARVLSRYLDAIVIRANRHDDVLEMADYADVPVINGLTDQEHPCQVLADLLTIMEAKRMAHPRALAGFPVAYVGDGNNVAHSWMLAAGLLGMDLRVACPAGYEPHDDIITRSNALAHKGRGRVRVMRDPSEAVLGARAVYTDVWASMGQEAESAKRRVVFTPYQVNAELLGKAAPDALVMHCLPAHRGEEMTEAVLEGKHSVIFDQAENRLHAQKAVLVTLVAPRRR